MGQGVLWAVCQFVSIWEPSIFFFFFPPFLVLGGNGGLGTPLSSIAKRGAITADDDQERKREEVSPEPFFFCDVQFIRKIHVDVELLLLWQGRLAPPAIPKPPTSKITRLH